MDRSFRISLASSQKPIVALAYGSLLFETPHSISNASFRFVRTAHIQNAVLFPTQLVVVHEELFQLLYEFLT